MNTFIEQAQFYTQYHQKNATFYTHLVGIPLIFFGMMIFLGFFQLLVPGVFSTTLAEIGTVILLAYYIKLNWRLGLMLVPFFILLLWISHLIAFAGPTRFALWSFIIVSLVGWGLQLVGHLIEGRRPAFMDNPRQALIAPLFLMAKICFRAGYMQNLKDQIYGQAAETAEIPPIKQDDVL